MISAPASLTVLVAPGTYHENIDFQGKAITLVSEQGASSTVIDGGLANPVVTFKTSEGNSSVLKGFTLQNGKATFAASYTGGGVSISGASPTITENVITKNQGGCSGIGIGIYFGSPIIQKNTMRFEFYRVHDQLAFVAAIVLSDDGLGI